MTEEIPVLTEGIRKTSFRDKGWIPKVAIFLFFVLVSLGVYLIFKKDSPLKTECLSDDDCLLVWSKNDCHCCPVAVNKLEFSVNEKLEIYTRSSLAREESCSKVVCEPCLSSATTSCINKRCSVIGQSLETTPTPFLPLPSVTPTRIPLKTGIWKVYQNKRFGFLLKYPPGFGFREFKAVVLLGPVPGELMTEFYPTGTSQKNISMPSLLLGYYENPEKIPLEDWFKQRSTPKNNFTNPDSEDADKLFWGVREIQTVNLNREKSLIFKSSNSTVDYQKNILMPKEDKIFLLQSVTTVAGSLDDYLDLMVPTFRFVSYETVKDPIQGQFCGGIAGNLPENQCPPGYSCKIEEKFPDAGGVCLKIR